MRRLPVAVRALLAQLAALAATAPLAAVLGQSAAWAPGLPGLAIMAGIAAAALGHALRLPPWWLPIQLLFLPAAVAASALHLPAWLYFAAFAALLSFYWSVFRTRVPLYLSGREAWDRLLAQLPAAGGFRFIDLGSGLGGLPLYLARHRPDGEYCGAEVAPAPWLISRLRAWLTGGCVRFLRTDYARLDLSAYDVAFVFLSPAAMPDIWRKAAGEMREGAMLFSLTFPVPGVPPDLVLEGASGAGHALYGWRMRRDLFPAAAAQDFRHSVESSR